MTIRKLGHFQRAALVKLNLGAAYIGKEAIGASDTTWDRICDFFHLTRVSPRAAVISEHTRQVVFEANRHLATRRPVKHSDRVHAVNRKLRRAAKAGLLPNATGAG